MTGNDDKELKKANAEAEKKEQNAGVDDELMSKELKEVGGGAATARRSKSRTK